MAKAKKRVATRKKASKRGKASAKPARKKAAKRAAPKKRPPKTSAKMASRKAPRKPPRQGVPVIEDTIIDVIDEPVPGVVRVTEYETIRTTTPNVGAGPETEEQ
jgi:hypothetical protein